MQEFFFICLQTQSYSSYTETGSLIQSESYLVQAPANKLIRIALVPSQEVLLTHAVLPPASTHKLLQAAPYAIEEQLIDDVENLYFAVGKPDPSGDIPIAVIKKSVLLSWLTQLKALSVSIKYLLPEALALPYTSGQWQILLTQQTALIRNGKYRGTAVDITQLPMLLNLLLKEEINLPEKINLTYSSEHADLAHSVLKNISVPVIVAEHATTAAAEFARGLAQGINKLNLLQSAYKLQKNSSLWNGRGRWTSYAILAVGVLWLGTQVSALIFLQQRNQVVKQQIEQLYFSAYPDEKKVIAPKTRLEQSLAVNDTKGGIFLDEIVLVGKQLIQQNYALTINNIDFRNNLLTLEVSALDFSTLATFNNALISKGYSVQQSNARSEKNQVVARLGISNSKG